MQRLCFSLCLPLLTILLLAATPGQAQVGVLLRTFDLKAGKLLLDPVRPQLYAALPGDNAIAVINTDTNAVATTLYTGSDPVDLAISPDGTRLYVLNGGSTTAGIGVVDLRTLTVLSSLPTPFPGNAIASGVGNRLYLLNDGSVDANLRGISQLDATTGAYQTLLPGDEAVFSGFLRTSPDHTTLFYGNANNSSAQLVSFDISTAAPTLLQSTGLNTIGGFAEDLAISHNGLYLAYPAGATTLIPTTDLTGVVGTFASGFDYGPVAFSADDSKLYEVGGFGGSPDNILTVYSTTTFSPLASIDLPTPGASSGYPEIVTGIAITASNGYLYVAGNVSGIDYTPADLMLVSTENAPFFNGSVALSDGFAYLEFGDGNLFGYYNLSTVPYLFHSDLGFEYPFDAADGSGGIYLYDFTSQTFFYTSPGLFPYLYDFTLQTFLYYYPNTRIPGHYTAYPRYFYNFASGQIITL